jgi:isocitrate dehydrogenase
LHHTFGSPQDARLLERAVEAAVGAGVRTTDIALAGEKPVTTAEMGKRVLQELDSLG